MFQAKESICKTSEAAKSRNLGGTKIRFVSLIVNDIE